MKVKFLKKHSINRLGSIAEYDKVLCGVLIDRGIAVEVSASDLKEEKEVKVAKKKVAQKEVVKKITIGKAKK